MFFTGHRVRSDMGFPFLSSIGVGAGAQYLGSKNLAEWIDLSDKLPEGPLPNSLALDSNNRKVFLSSGLENKFYSSSNGLQWKTHITPTEDPFNYGFIDDQYIVNQFNSTSLRSLDGGDTFHPINLKHNTFTTFKRVNSTDLFIVSVAGGGSGGIWISKDNGETWSLNSGGFIQISEDNYGYINSGTVDNSGRVVIVGNNGDRGGPSRLSFSTNLTSWTSSVPFSNQILSKIFTVGNTFFLSVRTGVESPSNWGLYRSTNLTSWTRLTNMPFNNISFTPRFVTKDGIIVITQDYQALHTFAVSGDLGNSWSVINSNLERSNSSIICRRGVLV